jgi:hypothetical protein
MRNTSHITQTIKIKQRDWNREETNPIFLDPGRCGVEVNERADLEAKQAIKEGRKSQLLLPVADRQAQWKRKAKWSFTASVKTPKGTEKKAPFNSTT